MGEPARIIEDFRRLSTSEKLALLDELWLEAARDVDLGEVTEGERHFLEERLRVVGEKSNGVVRLHLPG